MGMDDAKYSNRELDSRFSNLLEHMKGFETDIHKALNRIEMQTTKTNGQVASLKQWRAYCVGAISVLTVLVIPVLLALLSSGKI